MGFPALHERLWRWVNQTPPCTGTVWWRKWLLRRELRRIMRGQR